MRYAKQFGIILLITFIGEILKAVLPFPIPASIYGLLLMLTVLCTKILPLEKVHDAGVFLVEIMPIMFIPAAVGLMESWGILKPIFIPVIVITVVSTVLVMVVTGWMTQFAIRSEKRRQNG